MGGLVLGLLLLVSSLFVSDTPTKLKSVGFGNEYYSTTTVSSWAGTPRVIRAGAGTLGSVVVTGTHASIVRVMNATSSTDLASTTIATFAASPANGTYTFDAVFDRGLVVETLTGFTGSYVFTWR